MRTSDSEHAAKRDVAVGFDDGVLVERASKKAALRRELEAARGRYQQVLASTSDEGWGAATRNPKWTAGAILAHIVLGMDTVPLRIKSARRGKSLMVMPVFAFDFINVMLSRRMAARYRLGTIGREFDAKYNAMIRLLDDVRDGEWEKLSRVYIQRQTIEEVFRSQASHILGHLEEMTDPIGAPPRRQL
ncbi:MAG TPA: DinB family protein [Isosphaeraceae bacterium]|jgi:hypothetical protein|nr:DinB family protein [Isosphaeraceae bacterium]